MFYTYLLQSMKNGKFYVGYTPDLKQRLREHNLGLTFSTKPHRPWKVIYYEACCNQDDAKLREVYLKSTQGRGMLKRRVTKSIFMAMGRKINQIEDLLQG
ncbi:MAG TPA: GIY-YIG nuclease family protein [Candidatus Paceibacterota bacterium]